MFSLKVKLTVISLLIALVPLFFLGIIDLNKTTRNITDATESSLSTILQAKEAALESYLLSTEKVAKSFASTDAIQNYVTFLNRELRNDEAESFKKYSTETDNLLYSFMEAHWGVEYHHVLIADVSGKIVLSPNHGEGEKGSPSSHLGSDISDNPWFKKALQETQITDFSTWEESNHFHQLLLQPIKDASGKTQGVIVFELMISHERNLLAQNFKLGESGNIYLASLEGVPVVHLKDDAKEANTSKAMMKAIQDGSAIGKSLNEGGKEIIGFYKKNNKYPWIMVAEIETAEAFKDVSELRSFLIIGMLITTIIIIILSLILATYITTPLKKLTNATVRVTDGDFDVTLPTWKSNDEIGRLVGSIEMLIASLKISRNKKE